MFFLIRLESDNIFEDNNKNSNEDLSKESEEDELD